MPTTVTVPLNWKVVKWNTAETWRKVLLPRIVDAGICESDLSRSVYVIRLAGKFAINYSKGTSPAVYVGEGNFGSRIQSHRSWAEGLKELVGEFSFELCLATPRVRKQEKTYRDCEAVLLHRFGERYGSAPLWNKQFERRRFPHHHYSQRKLDYALGQRSGARYQWALRPMRASKYYESYKKTQL